MRLSFLVSTERQPQKYEIQFGLNCFANQQLSDMKVVTFIGNFTSSTKYGDYTAAEFANLFLQAFEKQFNKDHYGRVEQIHFLYEYIDYSRTDTTALIQKMVNELFIRGFYNVRGAQLMRPQSSEPLSTVYFVYDDIKHYYSTCRVDSRQILELVQVQFSRIQDKRTLKKAKDAAETLLEKNNFEVALQSLEKQIADEHLALKNKILDCCTSIDKALNDPNNPHLIPYGACENIIDRKQLCLQLNSIHERIETLTTQLQNVRFLTPEYFYRDIKKDKIAFLTKLLASNDLITLVKIASNFLQDNSTFAKNVKHGRHSKTNALIKSIANLQY